MPTPSSTSETSSRILDFAEHLVQTRGFNAFSYADIADSLRVTKASVHYHFPMKATLGERLIERYYTISFSAALQRIDANGRGAGAELQAYANIYIEVLDSGRMCLCGMLAADYMTLPRPMQKAVRDFFEANGYPGSQTCSNPAERAAVDIRGPADRQRAASVRDPRRGDVCSARAQAISLGCDPLQAA